MKKAQTPGRLPTESNLEQKWGKQLIDAGWVAIPSVILQRQRAFRLDPIDLNILLQIADHWWHRDNLPYPSKQTLAVRIGVTPRTIQRRISEMEKDGLIKRIARYHSKGGSKTNHYDLSGLKTAAEPYAVEILQTRKQRKRDRSERDKRKRPNLKLVKE